MNSAYWEHYSHPADMGIRGVGATREEAFVQAALAMTAVIAELDGIEPRHVVEIVCTEQGLADLRGLGPMERARTLIDKCAHPAYRDYLNRYLREAPMGHFRHDLTRCFELHRNLLESGSMLPGIEI